MPKKKSRKKLIIIIIISILILLVIGLALYEENVGTTIVSGKNQNPERNIPPIQHAIAVRDGVNATRNVEHQLNQEVELLSSAIDVSRTAVSSRDLQGMVKAVMDKQKTSEIQQHISEVKKTDEGR